MYFDIFLFLFNFADVSSEPMANLPASHVTLRYAKAAYHQTEWYLFISLCGSNKKLETECG